VDKRKWINAAEIITGLSMLVITFHCGNQDSLL